MHCVEGRRAEILVVALLAQIDALRVQPLQNLWSVKEDGQVRRGVAHIIWRVQVRVVTRKKDVVDGIKVTLLDGWGYGGEEGVRKNKGAVKSKDCCLCRLGLSSP